MEKDKLQKLYSVIDVETTGGKYNEEGITEIAIYKFDGVKIVDQFISLVNPEKPIQPYVQNLTGITNNMVKEHQSFMKLQNEYWKLQKTPSWLLIMLALITE